MRDQTIICIAPRRWDALWKETQAIMSRLAVHNRVLYFEPGRDPEHGVLAEMRRNWPILLRPITWEMQENLFVIQSPPVLPHGRRHLPERVLRGTMPPVMAINARLLIRHVRRTIRALAVESPVLWLTDPYHVSLVGRFGEKVACYFNFDEFADMAENRRVSRLVRRLDDELARRVDVVFATSRAQWERRRSVNPRTYLVPNAVDFDLFNRALTEELPVPADIECVARPILGFVGWLTGHIDMALLRRVSEAYPDCSLVLVGPGQLACRRGSRCVAEPAECRPSRQKRPFFDSRVSARARRSTHALQHDQVTYCPPIRRSSTSISRRGGRSLRRPCPSFVPYESVVRLAQTSDDFVQMIGQALADRSAEAIGARVAVARDNTWDQRVAEIDSILSPLLQSR